ncbi:GNAT family N-acetyltransferase [Streptomyces sp. NPDC056161]|uniref:GNAT family N-acetyltransferase n=1 Tax=Streptomyces sp. NPDC056161 TaxID=3345732 RepID=UPI0035DAC547
MTGHPLRIRTVADADWPQVAALEADAYAGSSLTEGQAALESRGRISPGTCFVLDLDGRIAGYVLALPYPMFRYPDLSRPEELTFHTRNLHLHDIVVAGPLRGRGLGLRLLRHLTEVAATRRYERISLVAIDGMEGFWRAHGYRPHPEVHVPPGYGTNAVYMSTGVHASRALEGEEAG